jgi:cytochrome P450
MTGTSKNFLAAFDAAPDDQTRAGLFFDRLALDWRSLFCELRERRPILNVPPAFVVVTRWHDVKDVLTSSSIFGVPYKSKMDSSVGPFMLAYDNTELNWHEKSVMRSLLSWDDLDAIRRFAGDTARDALSVCAKTGVVDVPKSVSRLVPLRVVQHCFGFPGPDDGTMLRWSEATQSDMFRNLENNKTIHKKNIAAGRKMQAWIRKFILQRKPWSNIRQTDPVSRLLRATEQGLTRFDQQRVVSNICGLLVGAIETSSLAIVNATEQILLRPDILSKAIAAGHANDRDAFDAIVWEALRFNPMTTMIVREARTAAVLGRGSCYETHVAAGQRIAAAVGSAMFDKSFFDEPKEFRRRDREAFLHMGFGPHECLGKYVAYAIVPETIRQILMLPGIRFLKGGKSEISYARANGKGNAKFPQSFVLGVGPDPDLARLINENTINGLIGQTKPRPYPYSLWSPDVSNPAAEYISWTGLVERSFTGRHLPPAEQSYVDSLPAVDKVIEKLFRREAWGRHELALKCDRSSALFCFFAQWFTDSFLRTDTKDRRKNTSNHEIDLCQIYGLDEATARALRTRQDGRLRMEESGRFPEHLYGQQGFNPGFGGLPYAAGGEQAFEQMIAETFPGLDEARRNTLYATGLERGNSTVFYTAISTVFVREHNRICRALQKRFGNWDDDRLFETARNINIVVLLRIIIEDYINHIAGGPDFKFTLQRGFAEKQSWYRTNRISLEFNLLYRWHSLVPTELVLKGKQLANQDFRFNNRLLEQHGVEFILDQASRQFAGRIGLNNTPHFLLEADKKTLEMGRRYRLQPYNSYRKCFNLEPYKSYEELTGDRKLSRLLRKLYGPDINRLELLVGLLAEKRPSNAILPGLMGTMVAVDAFSQALTNPLLSDNIYGKDAFSEVGLDIIENTRTFKDVVDRNAPSSAKGRRHVAFDVTTLPARDRL